MVDRRIADDYGINDLLRAALLFAETNEGGLLEEKGQAVIELLIDYLLPESDAAVLAKGDRITLTTAAKQGGVYNYTGNSTEGTPRATISRDPGNKLPFISTENGTIADGTSLIIENLILDGRNLAGSADGGALQSTNCSVTVRNTEIKNFVAGNGGGIYVNFTAAGGQLRISDSRFENCISKTTKNRQGGGPGRRGVPQDRPGLRLEENIEDRDNRLQLPGLLRQGGRRDRDGLL